MKRLIFVLLMVVIVACSPKQQVPVSVIFDTDMGPDYDDVGALAILHAMADSGEVNILGAVASNRSELVAPCIDVINTYFGRGDIPVGAVKGTSPDLTSWHKGLKWTDELPKRYPHKVKSNSEAEDAVKLYRRILSSQPDTSVTIVTVGFFSNLRDLLRSGADEYSELSGEELIKAKVKELVSMAGAFPEGREFNVEKDAEAGKYVAENWPTPIIFSGFEIGANVVTGKQTAAMNVKGSPVKDAYEMCLSQDDPAGRFSWDQTAVLVAVRGVGDYYNIERGWFSVDDTGGNTWTADINGKHYRLIEKMPAAEVASVIEQLMMHQPMK